MALTETSAIDKIEVVENAQIQVRTATRVFRDGTLIATTFHRHVVAPGDDLADEDPQVAAIAGALHTPKVVAAYQAVLAAAAAAVTSAPAKADQV